jgi:ribosomal protein S12 methylthiotransferase
VKELILIAQDLTHYGLDIYKKRNLAELLEGSSRRGYRMDPLALCFSYWFPMDVLELMK